MHYETGMCSVSFRGLPAERVIELAVQNGLIGIEWGSDVHLPIGDIARAEYLNRASREAGLDPASYGTYLRAGDGNSHEHLVAIADTAAALGAFNIRIWSGPRNLASKDFTPEQFDASISDISTITRLADERGMVTSLEFHVDSLADGGPQVKRILDAVNHPALFTYWQFIPHENLASALAQIELLADRISHLHVFNLVDYKLRDPLDEAEAFWTKIFSVARPCADWKAPAYAMLEFVKDDDFDQLARDSDTLRRLLKNQVAAIG